MPDASELLHMNLQVFSERDHEKRGEAIERTYVEDVRFIDPDGESVGREALNDRAQKILNDAPADFCWRRTAWRTSVPTPRSSPGASARRGAPWSAESTYSRCVMAA